MTPQPMMGFTTMGFACVAVVPLLCLVLLVWLWVRVLRRPKHYHAVCGHCQYIVEGLETMFCPECGSDFRKIGIEMPYKKDRIEPATFVVLWTFLLLPIALLIGWPLVLIGRETIGPQSRGLLTALVVIFWALVYVAGIVEYWHTRRRRAAEEAAAKA